MRQTNRPGKKTPAPENAAPHPFLQWARFFFPLIILLLAGCAPHRLPPAPPPPIPAVPVRTAPPEHRLIASNDPMVKGLKVDKVREWVANEGPDQRYKPERGKVSFYHEPQKMANGKQLDPDELTAAHRTLPLYTIVKCTRQDDGRSVVVMITDRGPHVRGRIIDLSPAAAHKIGITRTGLAPCQVEVLAYPYPWEE